MKVALYLLLSFVLLVPVLVSGRNVSPIVSTDWLGQNLNNPKLVMVDIRKVEEYKEGHIPGAINVFFGAWIIEKNKLLLELPADDDLLDTIGSSGIKDDSIVVVFSKSDNDFARADATRVAWTLITAGVKNVAVLDGGYAKWLKEKKAVSIDMVKPNAGKYNGKINKANVVSKDYVLKRIGKTTIVDTRTPDDFFGITVAPFAPKAGHIKSAILLPTPWVYTEEGTFRSKDDIEAMATGVIGKNKSKEVIIYCGVGGYASTWSFLLSQMLGYKNVKIYDGSMQEWSMDPNAPVTKYGWR
jgi:thiosulfate/3-mercaptopyruvate sulfurtransferase